MTSEASSSSSTKLALEPSAKLRELEALLRKGLGDEDLLLLEQRVEPLLQLGENYGSTILKVVALIRRRQLEEKLEMVAKMPPDSEFQRKVFDSAYTFRKEAFLYEELMPAYRRVEERFRAGAGCEGDEVLDLVPKLYGARFTLDGDEGFDDDAVILMENLKARGYYMADRRIGLDLEHAEAVVPRLAHFHALGIATKHHEPKTYQIIKHRSKCLNIQTDSFIGVIEHYKKIMCDDPVISRHKDKILAAFVMDVEKYWTEEPPEPWSTVIHSDFWVNNYLFHRDPDTNAIDAVKFVDFQNYVIMSPLRDLVFFLMTNLDDETTESSFDDLMDLYYKSFVETLEKLGCDTAAFSRDKFDERLRIDGLSEFLHCPFMIKIMTAQVDDPEKVSNFINLFMEEKLDPLFLGKLRRCVKKYVEKGWLDQCDGNTVG